LVQSAQRNKYKSIGYTPQAHTMFHMTFGEDVRSACPTASEWIKQFGQEQNVITKYLSYC